MIGLDLITIKHNIHTACGYCDDVSFDFTFFLTAIVFFSIHIDDDDNDDYCGEVPSLLPQFFVHCMTTTPC